MNEIEQIKEILSRCGTRADQRIAQIRQVLGVPALKRGRKKTNQDRSEYKRNYHRRRRECFRSQGKCVQCGKKNDRLPRTYCISCAAKNSPIVRRKLMKQRLEMP